MLPIDYASALDWRRGQQSNRSKISGMYRHYIVDHGLGNADQPATQLKKKVLLEANCGGNPVKHDLTLPARNWFQSQEYQSNSSTALSDALQLPEGNNFRTSHL